MGLYVKKGNIYKPMQFESLEGAKKCVRELSEENRKLKNRCSVYTQGALCPFCPLDCINRQQEYMEK